MSYEGRPFNAQDVTIYVLSFNFKPRAYCLVTESSSMLKRKNFKFVDWGMLTSVRHSKSIQFQERMLEIPIAKCSDTVLCAVYWTHKHFITVPADSDSLTFLIPNGDKFSPLDYLTCQKMLKYIGEKAGLDPTNLSSHSLRRGGALILRCVVLPWKRSRLGGIGLAMLYSRILKLP